MLTTKCNLLLWDEQLKTWTTALQNDDVEKMEELEAIKFFNESYKYCRTGNKYRLTKVILQTGD